MKTPILLSWSSGKDSAWTLYHLQQSAEFEVTGLVTTINQAYQRVAMHAVRMELLRAQAEAAGLPLHVIELPWPCSNEEYEARMGAFIKRMQGMGVQHMAFGDLFLEDVRTYREQQLNGTGITPVFPIWGEPTDMLAQSMVDAGLRAVVTCVDPKQLDAGFVGRVYDQGFLDDLPAGVDSCGENGEFHSFACSGPMFRQPVAVRPGEVVERDGFVFADLHPAGRPGEEKTVTA